MRAGHAPQTFFNGGNKQCQGVNTPISKNERPSISRKATRKRASAKRKPNAGPGLPSINRTAAARRRAARDVRNHKYLLLRRDDRQLSNGEGLVLPLTFLRCDMGKAAKQTEPETQQTGAKPKNPLPEQHQERPGIESKIHPRPQYAAPDYKGSEKLAGKAAIVTGGDSGIGRSVAVLYAREGADVAIVHLPEEQTDAEETKQAVEAEGRKCLLIAGDVKDSKFCQQAVDKAAKEFGHLDLLV